MVRRGVEGEGVLCQKWLEKRWGAGYQGEPAPLRVKALPHTSLTLARKKSTRSIFASAIPFREQKTRLFFLERATKKSRARKTVNCEISQTIVLSLSHDSFRVFRSSSRSPFPKSRARYTGGRGGTKYIF
jgi:hypothetical protein